MRIVDREQMKEVDRIAIEEFRIPDQLLMENAGMEFVNALVEDVRPPAGSRVAVLCGGGNNGGDGFVIARLLKRRGMDVEVYTFAEKARYGGPAEENLERLRFFGVPVREIVSREGLEAEESGLKGHDLFIDALLGVGFRGAPRGVVADAIGFLNGCGRPVFAVDLPSGVDANGGRQGHAAVRAARTYAIGALKFGLVEYPGKEYAGVVRVLDIGFPPAAFERVNPCAHLVDAPLARTLLPARRGDAHKGTYGHCGVLGGGGGYSGAALMAARAASRSGCGLVSVVFPEGTAFVKPDEIIARFYPAGDRGFGSGLDVAEFFSRYSAVVAGPGMGVSPSGLGIVGDLLSLGQKLVVDADGLNNLANDPSLLRKARGEVVLTPHIGEMSRLTGLEAAELKANARSIAADFAASRGVTVVLKDAVSVIASADGRVFINRGGVPALAKGGSGDVLSGIIGSLMARGLGGVDAAVLGVYLHTECGRVAGERLHPESVTAGDLIETIPSAFRALEGA